MAGLELVPGWRRMQGIVFRAGDKRFEGLSAQDAVRAALADPACIMVNRNQGAGTRILIDRLLGAAQARRLLESAEARTTPSPPPWRSIAPTGA